MTSMAINSEVCIGMDSPRICHTDMPVPPYKLGKHYIDDDVSTAAPSPRLGDLDSPISPMVKRQVAYLHKASSALRDRIPSQTVTLKSVPRASRRISPSVSGSSCQEAPCREEVTGSGVHEVNRDISCEYESQEIVKTSATLSPVTPFRNCVPSDSAPPPAPKVEPMPMLMRALRANSVALVREAIQAEPDVACFPFWDHGLEPPLCFAVRHKCKAAIIEVLLEHGAELDAKDTQGRSPADILRSVRLGMPCLASYTDLSSVEKLLNLPPIEPMVDVSAPWQFEPANMCRPLDWSVFDMRSSEPPTPFHDENLYAFRPAWLGA